MDWWHARVSGVLDFISFLKI